ncbi:serine hydrolase [Actinomycetes bacterium KLBMP 9797]
MLGHHRAGRHRATGTRSWLLVLTYLTVAAAGVAALVTAVYTAADPPPRVAMRPPARSVPTPPAPRTVALHTGPVYVDSAGFLSWALLDRRSGRISGSANRTAPSDTMSMVKSWIAADYLRRAAERGVTPSRQRMRELTIMIRDSDNGSAQTIFAELGRRASIERLIAICGLTDSHPYRTWWSNTTVSARDVVRIGACLADGRAAGPRWTRWLLDEMRQVRGAGDFGVRTALPDRLAARVAIKNGWLLRSGDGLWHISCLAIGEDWVLGVLARYPGALGFGYGTQLCQDVGAQLISPLSP